MGDYDSLEGHDPKAEDEATAPVKSEAKAPAAPAEPAKKPGGKE